MLDFEVDVCEKCGFVGLINRINEDFHFPCICHSPNHFLTHFLCNSCLQTFKPNPKESHGQRGFQKIPSKKAMEGSS